MTPTTRILSVLFLLAFSGCAQDDASGAEPETSSTDAALDTETPEQRAALAAEPRAAAGPFAGRKLFVEPEGNARDQAEQLRSHDPGGAAIMEEVADKPLSLWVGDFMPDVRNEVDEAVTRAGDELQVLTVYNIPSRDCGYWSAGGVSDAGGYAYFIDQVASGLEGRLAIVILEPDALGVLECLDESGQQERFAMLADAVDTLTAAGARVYLDAGDSDWVPADQMAARLEAAGVHRAAGFALNVSHTEFTSDEADYADELRAIIGEQAHYVVDTSRNGLGPTDDSEWCNPLGRAHGRTPTLNTGREGLDALLWIKRPGESDGYCNGGPEAGHWWAEYALELAESAGY